MLKVNTTIQDLHGIQYHQPLVVINHFNYQSTVRKESQINSLNPIEGARVFNELRDYSLSFNALLYVSEDAFNKGFKPLALRDGTGQEWFSIPLTSDPSAASEAELLALCEDFVLSYIIPQLELTRE